MSAPLNYHFSANSLKDEVEQLDSIAQSIEQQDRTASSQGRSYTFIGSQFNEEEDKGVLNFRPIQSNRPIQHIKDLANFYSEAVQFILDKLPTAEKSEKDLLMEELTKLNRAFKIISKHQFQHKKISGTFHRILDAIDVGEEAKIKKQISKIDLLQAMRLKEMAEQFVKANKQNFLKEDFDFSSMMQLCNQAADRLAAIGKQQEAFAIQALPIDTLTTSIFDLIRENKEKMVMQGRIRNFEKIQKFLDLAVQASKSLPLSKIREEAEDALVVTAGFLGEVITDYMKKNRIDLQEDLTQASACLAACDRMAGTFKQLGKEKEASAFRALANEKMEDVKKIMHEMIEDHKGNILSSYMRSSLIKSCQKTVEELKRIGRKDEALEVQSLIVNNLKEIAQEIFQKKAQTDEIETYLLEDLFSFCDDLVKEFKASGLQDEECEAFYDSAVKTLVQLATAHLEKHQDEIAYKPQVNEGVFSFCDKVIEQLELRNRTGLDLQTVAAKMLRGATVAYLGGNRDQISQNLKINQHLLQLCDQVEGRMRSIGQTEELLKFQILISETLRDVAREFNEKNKSQFSQDIQASIRALQLCEQAAKRLSPLKEVNEMIALENERVEDIKGIITHFIQSNLQKIGHDPKVTWQAIELCKQTAHELEALDRKQDALFIRSFLAHHLQKATDEFMALHRYELGKEHDITIRAHKLCKQTADALLAAGRHEEAFALLSSAARSIPIYKADAHPLFDLKSVFENLQKGPLDPQIGAHFSGLDTGTLKSGSFAVRERQINGKNIARFDFSINLLEREQFGKQLENILSNFDAFYASLPPGLCTGVKIREEDYVYYQVKNNIVNLNESRKIATNGAIKIEFEGLGTITIGKDPDCLTLYNAVTVELDQYQEPGIALEKLNQALTVLGLGPILQPQRQEDDERMKIGQLFKAYYPAKAYQLERTSAFYELPLDDLKAKMIQEEPEMEAIFRKYLVEHPELMKKEEIYPGEEIWTVGDLGDQLRALGALGFITQLGLGGTLEPESLALIIQNGLLSSKERFQAGFLVEGASSLADIFKGAGDQCFSRLFMPMMRLPEGGAAVMALYDLELANRVGYGYNQDAYGSKKDNLYAKRPPIFELTKGTDLDNEYMSKKTNQPKRLQGLVFSDKNFRDYYIKRLIRSGAIQTIQGTQAIKVANQWIPVDEFFITAEDFNANNARYFRRKHGIPAQF